MQRPDERAAVRGWRFESFEERLALCVAAGRRFLDRLQPVRRCATIEPRPSPPAPSSCRWRREGHGWTDVAAARDQFRPPRRRPDGGDHRQRHRLRPRRARRRPGQGLPRRRRLGLCRERRQSLRRRPRPAFTARTSPASSARRTRRYPGVAPDVDLVGLRVFDDQGNGYFNWVEQALRWVHNNRNAFDNPITTVNLSLGTDWNASTLPQVGDAGRRTEAARRRRHFRLGRGRQFVSGL